MKTIMMFVIVFISTALLAQEPMLQETPYVYVKSSIGKGKPYFLEVGSDSCHSCQIMGKLLYKVKQKHPEYQIAFINVKKERQAATPLQIRMIPTQIIYDKNGKEVYRHIGLLETQTLLDLLKKYQF